MVLWSLGSGNAKGIWQRWRIRRNYYCIPATLVCHHVFCHNAHPVWYCFTIHNPGGSHWQILRRNSPMVLPMGATPGVFHSRRRGLRRRHDALHLDHSAHNRNDGENRTDARDSNGDYVFLRDRELVHHECIQHCNDDQQNALPALHVLFQSL